MTTTLIRGRVLDFHADPAEVPRAHRYHEDGAVLVRDGLIVAVGEHAAVAGQAEAVPVVDHRPHLIMAGFIDPHIHFPQLQVTASYAEQLLDWLNDHTFPAEARFADADHAAAMAELFLDQLITHGTTTAAVYCSVHPASAEALFAAAHRRDMAIIAGKVMMDRNAPAAVLDTAQSGYDDTRALIARWHGKGRLRYAITPRFAITSTPEQLAAAGRLAAEHPDLHVQTHLSENHDEIALTAQLYPDAADYLDVYDRFGLLGPRTLMGHVLHLSDREIRRMAESGTRAIFCPTSNLFLGSGLFDRARLTGGGIVTGIATDIGGGTSWSMLQTMAEGYKVLQLQRQRLHPLAAFHWLTRGNAVALGLEDRIGTLAVGSYADLVVLNARATPAMQLRSDRIDSLEDELFLLQTMGDDRCVAQTYVAGRPMKSAAPAS